MESIRHVPVVVFTANGISIFGSQVLRWPDPFHASWAILFSILLSGMNQMAATNA